MDLLFSSIKSHNAEDSKYTTVSFAEFLHPHNGKKSLDEKHILRISIKAINGTMGPNELVVALLEFGVLPSFPRTNTKTLNQTERLVALRTAKAEMEEVVAETRMKRTLKIKIPNTNEVLNQLKCLINQESMLDYL